MAEKFDGQQVLAFLRRTGEELRKSGEELRDEAHRLLDEVRDPSNQQRVKDSLKELGTWFKRTTNDAAEAIESTVKKAEGSLRDGAERVRATSTSVAKDAGAKVPHAVASSAKRAPASKRKTASKASGSGAKPSSKPSGKKAAAPKKRVAAKRAASKTQAASKKGAS